MERRARLVVIGSSNTDMVVKVPKIPAPGETVLGGDLATVAGGKGANQAVAAARLGADVTFIGCVGDDAFGQRSLAGLASEGIDISWCRRLDGIPSGVALIAVDESGQNSIVVAPGANMRLSEEMIEAATSAIAGAHAIVMQCEIPLPVVIHAARVARNLNKLVILNPAPACRLPDELFSLADVLTPNETEARAVLGLSPEEHPDDESVLTAIADAGVPVVVLTLGVRGCLAGVRTPGRTEALLVPAFQVQAVDATAAGDAFTAALACALAERRAHMAGEVHAAELDDALRFATAAAAISVTRLGAQPSLPRRAEVDEFLRTVGR